jgi:hypothetical protein
MAEMKKRPIIMEVESMGIGNPIQEKILKNVVEYDRSSESRDIIIAKDDFYCANYGVSVIFVDYEESQRVVIDTDYRDGSVVETPKKEMNKKIKWENIEPMNFLMDDRTNTIDEAIDCIMYKWISYEELLMYTGVYGYRNIDMVDRDSQIARFDSLSVEGKDKV